MPYRRALQVSPRRHFAGVGHAGSVEDVSARTRAGQEGSLHDVTASAYHHSPHAFVSSMQRVRSLAGRRERLREREKAWRREVSDDAELYALADIVDVELSEHDLHVLYHTLTSGVDPEPATPRQLLQLLQSSKNQLRMFALRGLLQLCEAEGSVEACNGLNPSADLPYHFAAAIKPISDIVASGVEDEHETDGSAADGAVYELAIAVLQRLCSDEQHTMAVSDTGGAAALLPLIDTMPPGADDSHKQVVNCTVVNNVLNAVWLLVCSEGGADLTSYDEERGPVASLLQLLRQLIKRHRWNSGTAQQRKLRDEYLYADEPSWRKPDLLSSLEPDMVVLEALRRLALLKAYRGVLTGAGGIEHCTALLSRTDSSQIRLTSARRVVAASIVRLLMVDNSIEFVVLGGVPHAVTMLAPDVAEEHSEGLALLLHLYTVRGDFGSLTDSMVSAGALSYASALTASDDVTVRRCALRLLCLLCEHSERDHSFSIVQEVGCVEALSRMLRDDRLHVLQHCTALFWYLANGSQDSCVPLLLRCGSVPQLARLAGHSDGIVRHNAQGCLRCLECFDDAHLQPHHFLADGTDEQAVCWR